jgi:hypothetical protein
MRISPPSKMRVARTPAPARSPRPVEISITHPPNTRTLSDEPRSRDDPRLALLRGGKG